MKKIIGIFLITSLALNVVLAQSNIYFENETHEFNLLYDGDFPVLTTDTILMKNTNTESIAVKWYLTLDVPQAEVSYLPDAYEKNAWSVQVCDELQCFGDVFQAQSEIPPQSEYVWKLNVAPAVFLGDTLIPGTGTVTFEAIDTLKTEHIARFSATITVYEDSSTSIEYFNENNINIYPNPAVDFVKINILENKGIQQLSINNLLGVELFSQKINSGNSLEITNLQKQPSGLYLFIFEDENGKPLYQKLVNKK